MMVTIRCKGVKVKSLFGKKKRLWECSDKNGLIGRFKVVESRSPVRSKIEKKSGDLILDDVTHIRVFGILNKRGIFLRKN